MMARLVHRGIPDTAALMEPLELLEKLARTVPTAQREVPVPQVLRAQQAQLALRGRLVHVALPARKVRPGIPELPDRRDLKASLV